MHTTQWGICCYSDFTASLIEKSHFISELKAGIKVVAFFLNEVSAENSGKCSHSFKNEISNLDRWHVI